MQTNKIIKQHSIYSLLIVLTFFATVSLYAAEEEIKQLTADFATTSLSVAEEEIKQLTADFATTSLYAAEEETKQLTAAFATTSLSVAAEKKVKKENKQKAAAGQKKDLMKADADVQLRRLLGLLNDSNALDTHAQDSFDFGLLEQVVQRYNRIINERDDYPISQDTAADRLHAESETVADLIATIIDANKNPEETNLVLDLLDSSARLSFSIRHPTFFEIQK